jgi:hypothetical protein
MSHNLMDLHILLQGEFYIFLDVQFDSGMHKVN